MPPLSRHPQPSPRPQPPLNLRVAVVHESWHPESRLLLGSAGQALLASGRSIGNSASTASSTGCTRDPPAAQEPLLTACSRVHSGRHPRR
jgi:hypothetical protein